MDKATFEAIHKYGVVLSVVATALAVLASVVGGPIGSVALLFLGWAGPLGLFYFGGAYLTHTTAYASAYHVLGEELMRGVAWYSLSLIAWSVVANQTTGFATSPGAVFGLPAVTALGITLLMAATRYVTGSDLRVESEGGQLLVVISGGIAFGFLALFLVLTGQADWWLFALSLLSLPGGLALRWVLKQRYPGVLGAN